MTYHDANFETAAWWQDIHCPPQSVPLYCNGYDVSWTFAGTVVDAYFGSLFGGVPIGSYDKNRDIDRPGSYRFSSYEYAWAESVGTHRPAGRVDVVFELFPEYGLCVLAVWFSWNPGLDSGLLLAGGAVLVIPRLCERNCSAYYRTPWRTRLALLGAYVGVAAAIAGGLFWAVAIGQEALQLIHWNQ